MSENKKAALPSKLAQELKKVVDAAADVVKPKKKAGRVEIAVSKTNFNRVKFGTHRLHEVLTLEGYEAGESGVMIEGSPVSLEKVDLTVKPKAEKTPMRRDAPAYIN